VTHVLYCDARDRRHVLRNQGTASNGMQVKSKAMYIKNSTNASMTSAGVPRLTHQRPAWQARVNLLASAHEQRMQKP